MSRSRFFNLRKRIVNSVKKQFEVNDEFLKANLEVQQKCTTYDSRKSRCLTCVREFKEVSEGPCFNFKGKIISSPSTSDEK